MARKRKRNDDERAFFVYFDRQIVDCYCSISDQETYQIENLGFSVNLMHAGVFPSDKEDSRDGYRRVFYSFEDMIAALEARQE